MNLWQLNTFFLTFCPVCCAHTANRPKSEEKSVQLAEVHLYQIYFLQNPYFRRDANRVPCQLCLVPGASTKFSIAVEEWWLSRMQDFSNQNDRNCFPANSWQNVTMKESILKSNVKNQKGKIVEWMVPKHRLYTRWLDRRIYKTEMKFWAVLGRRGCREKKPPNCHKYATFWGGFFNFFLTKNIFFIF